MCPPSNGEPDMIQVETCWPEISQWWSPALQKQAATRACMSWLTWEPESNGGWPESLKIQTTHETLTPMWAAGNLEKGTQIPGEEKFITEILLLIILLWILQKKGVAYEEWALGTLFIWETAWEQMQKLHFLLKCGRVPAAPSPVPQPAAPCRGGGASPVSPHPGTAADKHWWQSCGSGSVLGHQESPHGMAQPQRVEEEICWVAASNRKEVTELEESIASVDRRTEISGGKSNKIWKMSKKIYFKSCGSWRQGSSIMFICWWNICIVSICSY